MSKETNSQSEMRSGTRRGQSHFRLTAYALIGYIAVIVTGCQSDLAKPSSTSWFGRNTINLSKLNPPQHASKTGLSVESRLDQLVSEHPNAATPASMEQQLAQATQVESNQFEASNPIVRAQSPQEEQGGFGFPSGSNSLFGGFRKQQEKNLHPRHQNSLRSVRYNQRLTTHQPMVARTARSFVTPT